MIKNTIAKVTCPCGRSFTKAGFARHVCDRKPPVFKCEFCDVSFSSEKRLFVHVCEQKRRHLQREDPAVRRGFIAYERFCIRQMGSKKAPTYEAFCKSSFYGAFVRFGRHTIDVNVLNLLGFVDFLLRLEVGIDKWTSLGLYSAYVTELNKTEPPLDAIERGFKVMQNWSVETGESWHDFFRKIEPPRAALWIANGKISPWVLFTASSAHDLLSRMTPEQTGIIEKTIDPAFWRIKLERNQKDVEFIRTMLAEQGV